MAAAGEPRPPTMHVIAGPNGAGKSTLYTLRIQPHIDAPFINADLIQKSQLQDQSVQGAYAAARIAEQQRREFMAAGRSFVTESTFSHPSKLELVDAAAAAGYRVIVHHVGVREPTLSMARVAARVKAGGHDVPPIKVIERFERNQPLIREAVLRADRAFVHDNSAPALPPRFMIEFRQGRVHALGPSVAPWAAALYAAELAHVGAGRLNPLRSSYREALDLVRRLAGPDALLRPGGDTGFFYQGFIVGETAAHWLQQHSAHEFTAHAKADLSAAVKLAERLRIAYTEPGRTLLAPFDGYESRSTDVAHGAARREAFHTLPEHEAVRRFPELASAYELLRAMLERADPTTIRAMTQRPEERVGSAARARNPMGAPTRRALGVSLRAKLGDALASGKLPRRDGTRRDAKDTSARKQSGKP